MTSFTKPCRVCHRMLDADTGDTICAYCAVRYPASLLKADNDNFDFAAKLIDGTEIHFCSCEITGDYVTLYGPCQVGNEMQFEGLPHSFPRGLDVRVDQILWCADAPDGS